MLRTMATTAAAVVTIALSATASADHDWWENDGVADRGGYDSGYGDQAGYGYEHAGYDDGFVYARVIDVEPIYRHVRIRRPQRECWNEPARDRPHSGHHGTAAATVAGGLIGGVIGRQFGDGKGRDAMTLVGTLIGSAMAHDNADRRNHRGYYDAPRYRTVERCATRHTMHEERRLEGYHVTYAYAGRRYMTRMADRPGDRIRVRVAVMPADYESY